MFEAQVLRVFISSREQELNDERLIAKETVESFGFIPIMSEIRGARDSPIQSTYLNEVRGSNIYICIFGSEFSEAVKNEFLEARANNIPTLVYVKEVKIQEVDLKTFIERIADPQTGITYARFDNIIKLREKIKDDISLLISKYFLEGIRQIQERKKKLKSHNKIEAELSPHKIKAGESFTTKATFMGTVRNGFFDNKILDPDRKKFAWSPDLYTWDAYRDTGTLQLDNEKYVSKWPTKIPAWAKPGEYVIIVGMFEDPTSTPRKERSLTASVSKTITVQSTSNESILLLNKLYRGFLKRDPDIDGLRNWYEYIISAKPRKSVIIERGFLYSPEFFIKKVYETLIGGDLLGRDYELWHAGITSGNISKVQVVHEILDQPEIKDRCKRMSPTEFVSFVNDKFLLNSLPQDEAKKWAEEIERGFTSKEEVVMRCTQNDRFFVIEIYKSLLGEMPSIESLELWVAKLSSGKLKRYDFIDKILKE